MGVYANTFSSSSDGIFSMNPETPVGVMILHTIGVGWGRIANSPGRLAEATLTNVRTFTLITSVDLDLPAAFGVIRVLSLFDKGGIFRIVLASRSGWVIF